MDERVAPDAQILTCINRWLEHGHIDADLAGKLRADLGGIATQVASIVTEPTGPRFDAPAPSQPGLHVQSDRAATCSAAPAEPEAALHGETPASPPAPCAPAGSPAPAPAVGDDPVTKAQTAAPSSAATLPLGPAASPSPSALVTSRARRDPAVLGAAMRAEYDTPLPTQGERDPSTSRPQPPAASIDLGDALDGDRPFGALPAAARWLPKVSSEGILWFVGVLLVLVGSLYFTRSNWSRWTPEIRTTVVSAGLVAYQFMFLALARLVARRSRSALIDPSGILAAVALGLTPIVGFALSTGLQEGQPTTTAAFVGLLGAVGGAAAGRVVGVGGAMMTLIAIVGVALAPKLAPIIGFIAAAGLARDAIRGVKRPTLNSSAPQPAAVEESLHRQSRSRLGYGALCYLAAAVGAATVTATGALWTIAPILALAAFVFARRIEASLDAAPPNTTPLLIRATGLDRAWAQPAVPRSSVAVASAAIAALLLCALATWIAFNGPLDQVGPRVSVLVTALVATRALAGVALALRWKLAMASALCGGLVAYFFVPAPFKALVALVLEAAQNALGYTDQPLPVAFYGITFVPYMAAVALASRRLEDRALRWTTELWLLVLCVGLMLMSMTAGDDVRPIVLTMPVYGAAFTWFAKQSGRRWLVHLAIPAFAVTGLYTPWLWLPSDLGAAGLGLAGVGVGLFAYPARRPVVGRYVVGLSAIAAWLAWTGGRFDGLTCCVVAATVLIRAVQHRQRPYAVVGYVAAVAALLCLVDAPATVLLVSSGLLLAVGGSGVPPVLRDTAAQLSPGLAAAAVVALIAGPADAWQWLAALALLLAAPWTTGFAPWAAAAPLVLAVGLEATTSMSLPLASTIAVVLASVAARICHRRGIQTARSQPLDPVLRVAVGVLAAMVLVSGHWPLPAGTIDLWLLGITAYFAFAALGSQLLLGAALALLVSAGIIELLGALDLSTHHELRLAAALVLLAAHCWCTASKRPARTIQRSLFVAPHAQRTFALLTYTAAALCAGLLAGLLVTKTGGVSWRDVAFAIAGLWLAVRVGGPVPKTIAGALTGAAVASFFGGPSWVLAGLAWGSSAAMVFGGLLPLGVTILAVTAAAAGAAGDPTTLAFVLGAITAAAALPAHPTYNGFTRALRDQVRGPVAAVSSIAGLSLLLAPHVGTGLGAHITCAAALAAGWAWLANRLDAQWAQPVEIAALALVFTSIVISPIAGLIARVMTYAAAAAAGWMALRRGRQGSVLGAVAAELAGAAMWLELRVRSPWIGDIPHIDAFVCIAGTFIAAGVYSVMQRRDDGAQAVAKAAGVTQLILPVIGLATLSADVSWSNAIIAMCTSATYAMVAKVSGSKWAASLAALAFDLAAALMWLQMGLSSPQIYALPVSVSLLVLAQIYRRDLSPAALGNIRVGALMLVYLSGFVTVMAFDAPHHALIMAVACAAGVLFGAAMRIRSYLLLGSAFLVVDLATNIVRFGLRGQTAATVVLVGLGSAIIACLVTWTLNRDHLETRVRRMAVEIGSWGL